MPASLPEPAQVLRAIEVYLQSAYDGNPPLRVRSQMNVLQAWQGDFFKCNVFVSDRQDPPTRYFIRLGNPSYPHMKMAIELPPNGEYFIYRVDTHDRHCCPAPDAREYREFCQLMESNKTIADRIEAAWEAAGVPTFKSFLRDDLNRRKAATQG